MNVVFTFHTAIQSSVLNSTSIADGHIENTYEQGIKLTQKAMQKIESMIERLPGIEKWAAEIPCYWASFLVDLFFAT